jgi:hypothetical protein
MIRNASGYFQRFISGRIVKLIFMILISEITFAKTLYVSTTGNDSNDGSQKLPFATLSKAASIAVAGDTIYIRGGLYSVTSTITLGSTTKNGTSTSYYNVFAFPGEKPVFDFSKQTSSDGIKLNGKYWYMKGIESMYAPHNGIAINGSYNIVENCCVHDNKNTGLQIGNGGSYNRIINCDSYYNYDPPSGGNADGFSPKLDVGTGNYFYGCRAWQNSDDGWDGYLRPADNVTTTVENCWSFMNGYLKSGAQITSGNGNGFKMGGGDNSNGDSLRHNMILKNCLCFDNRVKGYDQNNNRGSMKILNCTGFRNGSYNFSIPGKYRGTSITTVKNCISLLSPGITFIPAVFQSYNSWQGSIVATEADFLSIDTTGARRPRKADGSLPDLKFLHLSATSKFIDAGTDVGIPFTGKAPDLGAFENGIAMYPVDVEKGKSISTEFELKQNYPNPFNPSTIISYQIPTASHVTLKVYDMLGREVVTLVNEFKQTGIYNSQFSIPNSQFPSGVYLYRLQAGKYSDTKKFILMK